MTLRIALYSHDSVGLGHVRRNLAIAHALAGSLPDLIGETVTGMLISGQSTATSFSTPPGWDWMILPSISPALRGYAARHLATGIDRVTAIRGGSVDAALAAFAPDLVIVDRHPFGAAGELTEALRMLRADRPGCALVLGLRDLLDHPSATRREWKAVGGAGAVSGTYDAVWVYGDPDVHDLTRSGELPSALAGLVRHTGYLAHGRPTRPSGVPQRPFVLTTVGGGSDGYALASAAARATVPEGLAHLIVTGPDMPAEQRRALRRDARPGTLTRRRVPDALAYMSRAEAVVSMGGYNTVAEAMSTETAVLVVPRETRRQEQLLRARALAARGAIDTLSASEATPESLSAWFALAVGTTVHRRHIDLDGLAAVPRLAAEVVAARRGVQEGISRAC
ncbi:glycosyltransferase family protein [Microbacterium sp.]|uniref:glycosyltransferase family protein n=1 Tax=Microbacterium sp. TaxID=51671 RepID=UPI003A876AA0